ncbi:MAG: TIR domain-containing protein [Cyanobacteria bacterium Co-bin13]|nr:TIR domain-containing protein [Cyanobacteria bacterium Co-bin13]
MADVFISYSRKDKDFVQVLHQALIESQYETWVDWEGIPLTADWWEEIKAGIDAADTFVFVISPDSIASKVCGEEVDYAVAGQKRLMPIVRRDGFDMAQVRPALGRHNWLFFREADDFKAAFQSLITALNTDLDHVKAHTRLLVRAREWEQKSQLSDLLLRGRDLEAAEDWLTQGKQPYPSDLHRRYISSSRKAETQRQQQERRRLRTFLAAVTGLAGVAIALALFALAQRREAVAQRDLAYQQAKIAFSRQLAVEAQDPSQRQLARLQKMQQIGDETIIALGLAALSTEKVSMVEALQPQLVVLSGSEQFMAVLTGAGAGNADTADLPTLLVWNLSTQAVVLTAQPDLPIVDVDFSPDDQILTATTQTGELRLWRVDSQAYELIATIPGQGGALLDSAFSPSGRYLVTAADNGIAQLWDITQLETLTTSQSVEPMATLRHQGPVNTVALSQDEAHIVTGSQDQLLRVWSMQGQPLLCIDHDQPVRLVGFDAEQRYLGSVSSSSLVRIWHWDELIQDSTHSQSTEPQC